jgi:hypothetical protein
MLEEACLKKGIIFFQLITTLFCEVRRCFVGPWKCPFEGNYLIKGRDQPTFYKVFFPQNISRTGANISKISMVVCESISWSPTTGERVSGQKSVSDCFWLPDYICMAWPLVKMTWEKSFFFREEKKRKVESKAKGPFSSFPTHLLTCSVLDFRETIWDDVSLTYVPTC